MVVVIELVLEVEVEVGVPERNDFGKVLRGGKFICECEEAAVEEEDGLARSCISDFRTAGGGDSGRRISSIIATTGVGKLGGSSSGASSYIDSPEEALPPSVSPQVGGARREADGDGGDSEVTPMR